MVATAKRYRVKLTMPACVSIERRRVLEAFGAELILTPPGEGTDGAIRLAPWDALDPQVFITDHAGLDDVENVFKRLAEGYEGIKIAIHMRR
jgi:cysteine synthase